MRRSLTGASFPTILGGLEFVTRPAQHAEVGDVVVAAPGEWNEVVTLPEAGFETDATGFTATPSSFEPVLTVLRILLVFVRLPIWVAFVSNRLVDRRFVGEAIVSLRRPGADQTRAKSTGPLLVQFAARRTAPDRATTHEARLRPSRRHQTLRSWRSRDR